ncbi:MAG: hypothetical protein ACOX6V_00575 [Patescibacteria group bacterium]|jgi:hypothetical protein
MKAKLFLITLLSLLFVFSVVVSGQETEEATESAVSQDEVRQKLKERLEKTVQEDEDGAATSSSSTWRAYFGNVSEAALTTLSLTTSDKRDVQIKIAEDCELSFYKKGKGNSTLEAEKIETGWFAIAMGTEMTEGTLTAKRISFSETVTPTVKKKVLVGRISEIDDATLKLDTSPDITISIPKTYSIQIKGIQEAEIEDVSVNDKAVLIIEIETVKDKRGNETTTYTLKSLYSIPSTSNPRAADNEVTEASPAANAEDTTNTETEEVED